MGTLNKWLFTLLFAICLTSMGYAHGGGHGGGGHWHGGGGGWGGSGVVFSIGVGSGYYGGYPGYYGYPGGYYPAYRCGWVRGHYEYGYWVPTHRVCWYY